jgi:MFS family permease
MSIGLLGMSFEFGLASFVFFGLFRTLGNGTLWVFSAALLHILVPDEVRGRVFAFDFAVLTLFQSISIGAAGWFQDSFGLSIFDIIFISSILSVAVTAYWGWFYYKYKDRPLIQMVQ